MSRLNNSLSLTLSFTSTHALYPLQRWILRSSERGFGFFMRGSTPVVLGPTADVLPICDASPVTRPDVPVVS